MKHITKILLFVFLLVLGNGITYGAEDNLINGKHGADITMIGTEIMVQDMWYTEYLQNNNSNYFATKKSDIKVKLWFDDALSTHYSLPWLLDIQYDIVLTNQNGIETTIVGENLTIDYHPTSPYKDINIRVYENDTYVKAKIENIQIGAGGNSLPGSIIPNDIHLDVELNSIKYYNLESNEQTVVGYNSTYLTTTKELELYWSYVEGAESYDVEWLFIDIPEDNLTSFNGDYDFRNATRINSLNTNYKISMAYPRGLFLFRVRPVGKTIINTDVKRVEGSWSMVSTGAVGTVSTQEKFEWTGLLTDMNWQYQASFAEEGKRGEMLNIYDGSLKPRQNMAINNTDNTVIIGQQIYDYLGRPTLNLLPVPEDNQGLGFYPNRTQMSQGGHYDYTNFDTDAKIETPDAMTGLGVNDYYNDNGTAIGVNSDYVANAGDYPFSRTTIANDGTGRIKKQTMYGNTSIGGSDMTSDHITTYYYGTPTQEELYRLFGNEVGNVSHYKKNMVIDQNGQAHVQYIDMSGRVIATALTGNAPSNLETIDSYPTSFDYMVTDLSQNNEISVNGQLELNKTILVGIPTIYTFEYSLLGEDISDPCMSGLIDYHYDLHISIVDENNVPQSINYDGTLVTEFEVTNLTAQSTLNWTASLGIGTYTIKKVLTLNESHISTLYTNYTTTPNASCFGIYSETTGTPCNPDCIDLCFSGYGIVDDEGTKWYQAENGDYVAKVTTTQVTTYFDDYTSTDLQLILDAISDCESNCNAGVQIPADGNDECEIKYNQMKADMSPGGQYFDNVPFGATTAANDLWLSSNVSVPYTQIDPNATSWTWIRENWQDNYLDDLIKEHPEYCMYQAYCGTFTYGETNVPNPTCAAGFQGISPVEYNLLMNGIDYNIVASSPEEYLFNPMNYPTSIATTTAADKKSYQPYVSSLSDNQVDPYMACRTFIHNDIKLELQQYFDASQTGTEYHSIWFVLDDPLGIHLGNGGYSQVTVDFYQNLHGDGTSGNPGIIGVNPGQMTKYSFFRSTYLYFRDYVNYTAIQAINNLTLPEKCGSSFIHLNSPLNNGLTSEGFIIHFPTNAVYDNFSGNGIDTYITTELNTQCATQCEQNALNWLTTLDDCASASDLAIMEDYFIDICTEGCGVDSPTGTDDIGASIVNGPWGNMSSFEDVVTYYNTVVNPSGSCETPTHPMATPTEMMDGCECNNVTEFVTNFYLTEGVTVPTTFNLSSDLTAGLQNDIVGELEEYLTDAEAVILPEIVTLTTIQSWLTECVNNGTVVTTLPSSFECSGPPTFDLSGADEDCGQALDDLASYYDELAFNQQVQNGWENFLGNYSSNVWNNFDTRETFTMSYELNEYHYTLFYYDRAGNLIKTVPPSGVYRKARMGNEVEQNSTLSAIEIQACFDHIDDPDNNPYVHPGHHQITNYRYNSLQQLVESTTPDGGTTKFWYDELGRLIVSQNEEQAAQLNNTYSYTIYDILGRVTEAGQISGTNAMTPAIATQPNTYYNWLTIGSFGVPTRTEVMKTIYDGYADETNVLSQLGNVELNALRNRIGSVIYMDTYSSGVDNYDYGIHYSYDYLGNVKTIIDENAQAPVAQAQYKRMDYIYDLVSGNVKEVDYQKNEVDEFYYRYEYDANNRLTVSYTSLDGDIWEKESKNFYYAHGPLARLEIGDKTVQAQDFAYTINGWLKTVNSSINNQNWDAGKDGKAQTQNQYVGRDAYGYSLHYYEDAIEKDYEAVNSTGGNDLLINLNNPYLSNVTVSQDLYNGNIKAMAVSLTDVNEDPLRVNVNAYKYDQLQRIKKSTTFVDEIDGDDVRLNNELISAGTDGGYDATYTYDGNGNLLNLTRKDGDVGQGINLQMDDLEYHYTFNSTGGMTNQLTHVVDNGDVVTDVNDFETQIGPNFVYNKIGQLTSDPSEDIASIEWTVTGKVKRILFNDNLNPAKSTTLSAIEYSYNPMGMRVSKKVIDLSNHYLETFYVYDASGNVISTYEYDYRFSSGNITYKLIDNFIYGSKRLGVVYRGLDLLSPPTVTNERERILGDKRYELADHRGNVMEVVSDRLLTTDNNTDNIVDYYEANVVSYSDYFPFGMLLPNRHGSTNEYRYGYQGSEKDDEIKGEGNSYTTHFRQLDVRVARWLSIDPKATPWESPYVSMGNNPIMHNDILGDSVKSDFKNAQNVKALGLFMETRHGRKFIGRFAAKGQTIAGHTYEKDGKYHKAGIDLTLMDAKGYDTFLGVTEDGGAGHDHLGGTGIKSNGRLQISIGISTNATDSDDEVNFRDAQKNGMPGGINQMLKLENRVIARRARILTHELFIHGKINVLDFYDNGLQDRSVKGIGAYHHDYIFDALQKDVVYTNTNGTYTPKIINVNASNLYLYEGWYIVKYINKRLKTGLTDKELFDRMYNL